METTTPKDAKKKEEEEEEEVANVRPIKYGSADPPPVDRTSKKDFEGRGGVWHCENCDKAKLLPPGTKEWKCPQCQKTMYTTLPNECPLQTFCPCCCWNTILGTRGF
jgi:hypothetical protein